DRFRHRGRHTAATDPTVGTTEPTTASSSTTTDPTIDPDTGGSESGGTDGPGCTEDDACTDETVEADCGVNFNCVACFCVPDGDAPLCPDGWGDGEYDVDCGNGEACESDLQTACAGGPSDSSVCLFLGCEDLCDCPAPPEGFEELGRCEDQFGPGGALDDINDCFLDCSGGETCPDGMFCGGGVCYAGDGPPPATGFGDCVNNEGCGNANEGCIADNPGDPTLGFCTSGCRSADDCNNAPDTGDAPVTCEDLSGDSMGNCFLDCAGGETCPDGMSCAFNSFCAWDVIPDSGYADCASLPDSVCLANEACIENVDKATGTTEVCAAADCVDPAMDCPDLPVTGDAPAACANIDGAAGDECVLDCSAAQTCPDGSVCTEDGFCSYEVPTFTFFEDFQGGAALPAGWIVQNVDGLTPDAMVSFVDDAWVVADNQGPLVPAGEFWAVSTSWYAPVGASDDWIISPVITLGATATLQWSAFTINPAFPDGYEVYVVPTTVTEFTDFVGDGDPTAFLALDPLAVPSAEPAFEIPAEEGSIQNRSVDIGALAGQDVHVAFRNNSNDALLLFVDNISVIE
ncbi:MAG: choice-of-anchor J domain-containing protein, partial [Nannocystaceae bacterium]|nr:choice-of-anchor J domain-containing protein [Nannocystaceae bacterium]